MIGKRNKDRLQDQIVDILERRLPALRPAMKKEILYQLNRWILHVPERPTPSPAERMVEIGRRLCEIDEQAACRWQKILARLKGSGSADYGRLRQTILRGQVEIARAQILLSVSRERLAEARRLCAELRAMQFRAN